MFAVGGDGGDGGELFGKVRGESRSNISVRAGEARTINIRRSRLRGAKRGYYQLNRRFLLLASLVTVAFLTKWVGCL